ncbi:hypothetical protein IAR55_002502 [Kwoniella newhampshirensis]|uniref:Histone-lysine N-methyltransferase SUV39H n=1 Tax=Kwoniella newhampshirensis TaxID=1651941 RepID=A0AAW0Z1N0_9TREE
MSASQRGGGKVEVPVVLDSSDEDAPKAGPSGPKNNNSASKISRRTSSLRSERGKVVDLTLSDSGDDVHASSRNRSPTKRRRPISRSSRRISMADLPDAIDVGDETPHGPGPSSIAGPSNLSTTTPKKEPDAAVGSWGNPQVYQPPGEVVLPTTGPSELMQDDTDQVEDPQEAANLQTDIRNVELEPNISIAPSGTWANPAPYVPPTREASLLIQMSPPPDDPPLVPSSPLEPLPSLRQASPAPPSPAAGSWLNPVPYVPSPPRDASPLPPEPDGSWLHPVPFVPPPSLKRAMEATSSPSREDSPTSASKRRKGNAKETHAVATRDQASVVAAINAAGSISEQRNSSPKKQRGPKWVTDADLEAGRFAGAVESLADPQAEAAPSRIGDAAEPMEIQESEVTVGEQDLIPLPGIFGTDGPEIMPEQPSTDSSFPSPAEEQSYPQGAISPPPPQSQESQVVETIPNVEPIAGALSHHNGEVSASGGPAFASTTEVDTKPILPLKTNLAEAASLPGVDPYYPIDVDVSDDDLADLTSNDGEARLEEEIETVRAGVDEVDIDAPDVELISSRASTAPSIEEITMIDGKTFGATSRRSSNRISERSLKEVLSRDQALLAIKSNAVSKSDSRPRIMSFSSSEGSQSKQKSPSVEVIIPTRSRRLWRRLVEMGGESEVEDILDQGLDSPPSSGPSNGADLVEYDGFTVHKAYSFRNQPAVDSSSSSSSEQLNGEVVTHYQDFGYPDPPRLPERTGYANRILDTKLIDEWNRRRPNLTNNPSLHRAVFEAYMAQSTSRDEPQADEIKVVNDVDSEGAPPDFEFQYSNDMLYNPDVPDPELSLGCSCDGPCDPKLGYCSCVKRQEAYFCNLGMDGFAYDNQGHIKETSVSVWECSETCGCPPECMNRVIQRGRSKETKIELFKTRFKGWGVRARAPIPSGTFIGVYAGEMITEQESEIRGMNYAKLGRTYLFDCDGWQIANPPEGLDKIDGRAAELAATCAERARIAAEDFNDTSYVYSAYSVDAFHYGFTRYFNHSCDPNLAITQAYVKDFHPERPILVIFARRPIRYGEELCISYKGLPDEEDPPLPSPDVKSTGRRGKKKNSKTSASAHITNKTKSKVAAKDQCMCGTARCDGRMFNYGD